MLLRGLLALLLGSRRALSQSECVEFEVGSRVVFLDCGKGPADADEPPNNQLLTVEKCFEREAGVQIATVRDLSQKEYTLGTDMLRVIAGDLPKSSYSWTEFSRDLGPWVFTLTVVIVTIFRPFRGPGWLPKAKGKAKAAPKAVPGAALAGSQNSALAWTGWKETKGTPPGSFLTVRKEGNDIVIAGAVYPHMDGRYSGRGEVQGRRHYVHSMGEKVGRLWYGVEAKKYFIGSKLGEGRRELDSAVAVYFSEKDPP